MLTKWNIDIVWSEHADMQAFMRFLPENIKRKNLEHDLRKHARNMKLDISSGRYKIVGDIASYILADNLTVVTVMFKKNKKKRPFKKRTYKQLTKREAENVWARHYANINNIPYE